MSLVTQITDRFKSHQGKWIPGGSIERWVINETVDPNTGKPYTASNARRRLRELVADGVLHQKEEVRNGVNHAWYMFDLDHTTLKAKPTYRYEPTTDEHGNVVMREIVT